MRLTQYTDYSLRVLLFLAVHPGERITIRRISERFGISRTHLMKVVQRLSALKYLEATPGRNGGLALARKPERIRIGQVVRDMEPDMALVECMRQDNECLITPACALRPIFGRARRAFVDELNRYTLADLVGSQRGEKLARLLSAA